MAATFASYASVAIENARLYEAAHDQAWVSTVLLQVAEATQDLTTLNELLSTVVHITPMLAGVTACAVYMLDELEEAFIPAASEGLSTGQRIEFERWRFAAGDLPALDLLRQEKQPVVFHGLARSPQMEGVSFTNQPADLLPGSELMVLIPLLARGELLGALVVEYSNDLAARSSPAALERMVDERLAIVQGIAHQTAVAVENIRLLKAQKEEAYISVALLQVAQTVASSGDLEDTLGAIVRLTPILAGVRRSALFLWERGRLAFRLSQVYGLPRAQCWGGSSPWVSLICSTWLCSSKRWSPFRSINPPSLQINQRRLTSLPSGSRLSWKRWRRSMLIWSRTSLYCSRFRSLRKERSWASCWSKSQAAAAVWAQSIPSARSASKS